MLFRNGKLKAKDSYTGAIAIILQKETNCSCIYKIKNNNNDANYDLENNKYKEELLRIINEKNIKLLLDIHGASDKYGFGIDIATDNEINLNDKEIVLKIPDDLQPSIFPTGRSSIQMQYELADNSYLEFEIFLDKIVFLEVPKREYSKATEGIINSYEQMEKMVKQFYGYRS